MWKLNFAASLQDDLAKFSLTKGLAGEREG
jgi:hypothetical protein